MSFDEIEKLRNLSPSTIASHRERLVQASRDIDIRSSNSKDMLVVQS
jgi:hypothetical protein